MGALQTWPFIVMTSAALMRLRECVERSKVEAGTACYQQRSEADAGWPQS